MTFPRLALRALLCGLLAAPAAVHAAEGEPSLDRLLELNAVDVFGAGDVKVSPDLRVDLKFRGGGQFNKLFDTRGVAGKGFISTVEGARAVLAGPKLLEGADDVFSCVAIESGTAISRFELADDFVIKFNAKIPSVVPAGSFTVLVNQQDGRNFLQTSFFQDITVVDGGRKRRKPTSHRYFAVEPTKWFDKTPGKGVPVEIMYKGKKVSIFLEMDLDKKNKEKSKVERVEVVSQEGIDRPSAGKVVFSFNKLSLLIGNLSIQGKLNRPWAEAEIARLRKDGKLKLKPEEKPAESGGSVAAGERKAAAGKRKASVDEPDPEAEDDL